MTIFPRYVASRQYNDYLIRGNIRNANYWHKSFDGRWKFYMNRQGFRNLVDYSYPKPGNTLRILVLGDSFTVGYEVAQEETYSAVLERELREKGYSVEVINTGVSGFSNAEELVFLEQEGIRYHPDIVVLGFYANDLDDNVRAGLFTLTNDQLVLQRKDYAPAAKIRDFLNSLFVYRWLSENSYLHNYLNIAASQWMVSWFNQERHLEIAKQQSEDPASPFLPEDFLKEYRGKLACRLVERMHQFTAKNKALLFLLEIPGLVHEEISNRWPVSSCSPQSVSGVYIDGLALLKQKAPHAVWYRPHGHRHWTPITHEVVGRHLAALILKHPKIPRASFAQTPQK